VSNTARIGNVSSLNKAVCGSLFGWRKSAAAASSKSPHREMYGRKIDNEAQISDQEGAHRIPLAELMNCDTKTPKPWG
jgi:hypothetical protein